MRIGLIGTYDVNNFGDCMFPELYVHELQKRLPEASFRLYSPRACPAEILSFKTLEALPATLDDLSFAGDDALVLTGGETVGVGHSSGTYIFPGSSLSSYLRLWLAPAVAAARPGGPRYIAHCVGATKMTEKTNRAVAQTLAAGRLVTFRDRFSQSWVRDGEITYDTACDPMFLLDGLLPEAAWQARAGSALPKGYAPGNYIVAQITPSYTKGNLSAWVDQVGRISERMQMPVLLLPICHFLFDEVLLQKVQEMLAARGIESRIATGRINVKDTAALIGCSGGYCGTSLHGAVTAVAFARPLAVLGHSMDGKHEGTLQSVGLHGAVSADPAGLAACFETTLNTDRAAVRARAHEMAALGLSAVVESITGPPHLAFDPAQVTKAAGLLVAKERSDLKADRVLRFKRLVLGTLMRFPGVFGAIRRFRIRRDIRTASGEGL